MLVGGEQPFLFFPEGLDVRWRSFDTVAEQAAGGRRALEALGLRSGPASGAARPFVGAPVVAYAWTGGRPGADAVAADLAIRSGGWTAAPVPVPHDRCHGGARAGGSPVTPPEHDVRLLLPWEGAPPAASTGASGASGEPVSEPEAQASAEGRSGGESAPLLARLPAAAREIGRRPGPDRASGVLPPLAGGVLVRGPGTGSATGDEGWRFVSPEPVAEAAAELGAILGSEGSLTARPEASGLERRDGRPVLVAWLDPSSADGRVLLEWAIRARAALYLEPDPRILGGAAAWVRPTVVAGDAWALAAVAAEIRRREGGRSRRRRRRPFGRLRQAVVLGGDRLSEADRALFDERGVALARPELKLS